MEFHEHIKVLLHDAQQMLKEVEEHHIPAGLWNTSVNRLYYCGFYAVSALLLHRGIDARTHNGVKRMLGEHFVRTGEIPKELGQAYTDLFDMRQDADYEPGVYYDGDDVRPLVSLVRLLLDTIENKLENFTEDKKR